DMSKYAPGLYEADNFYVTSSIKAPGYLDEILEICDKENVSAILSLIDPELSLLANNKEKFESKGITLLQSSKYAIDLSLDKFQFYNEVSSLNFKTQRSFTEYKSIINELEENTLEFPLFVKPNLGSASINNTKVFDIETLNNLFNNCDDLIVQEFIDGLEYGVDVYIDFISKKVVSIFVKEKMKMRAGETDKSIAIRDDKLFKIIENFVLKLGYIGQIDIDIFKKNGVYYISE